MRQPDATLFSSLDKLTEPLRVWSRVLNCRVLFAGERTRIHPMNPYPVYRSSDLRVILALKPDATALRVIHEVSLSFGLDNRITVEQLPPPRQQAALFEEAKA